MRLERKKNTIRNTTWGVINRAVALLGPFAIRTIIIYILGTEYLGLSSLFSSILQVLSMAELGFSSAIAYSMYNPIANNDEALICALLRLYRKVYKVIGFVILGLGLCLMPFLRNLINGDVPADINIYYLYALYLFNASISYLMYAYKSVLFSAYQREDIMSKIQTSLLLIQYVIQILILLAAKNYYAYYIIVPLISIINNILIEIMTKKYYPKLIPTGQVPEEILRDVKEKVSGVVVSKFCGLTRNTFDSIIISAFLGLTTVAIYSNYYYILSNIASVIVIMVTSMRAGIGNSVALETCEKNYSDYQKFTFMYAWIAGWCAICLLCLYQPFMKLWMGEANMFPFYIVVLLCIYFLGQTMGDITNAYSGAVGLWWENRYRTLLEAGSNLFLNIIFGYFFGVFGIILATIVTIFVYNFVWQTKILFDNYFKEYSLGSYIMQYMKYNVITVIVAAITLALGALFDFGDLGNLLYRGVLCLIIPNILFLVLYSRSKVFRESKLFILKIVKKLD